MFLWCSILYQESSKDVKSVKEQFSYISVTYWSPSSSWSLLAKQTSIVVAFFRRFYRICFGFFMSLDFEEVSFLSHGKADSLSSKPLSWRPVPCIYAPRNRVAQAPDSFFFALYDPQGCGGGIVTRLNTVSEESDLSFMCSKNFIVTIWTKTK
jgi:hypothetical protein